jgi:hypothetical protein
MLAYRRIKNVTGAEAARVRAWMQANFGNSTIVAAPDKMVALKNFSDLQVQAGQPPAPGTKNLKGTWKAEGLESYEFDLEGGTDKRIAKFEGNRLVLAGEGMAIAFVKED